MRIQRRGFLAGLAACLIPWPRARRPFFPPVRRRVADVWIVHPGELLVLEAGRHYGRIIVRGGVVCGEAVGSSIGELIIEGGCFVTAVGASLAAPVRSLSLVPAQQGRLALGRLVGVDTSFSGAADNRLG